MQSIVVSFVTSIFVICVAMVIYTRWVQPKFG